MPSVRTYGPSRGKLLGILVADPSALWEPKSVTGEAYPGFWTHGASSDWTRSEWLNTTAGAAAAWTPGGSQTSIENAETQSAMIRSAIPVITANLAADLFLEFVS